MLFLAFALLTAAPAWSSEEAQTETISTGEGEADKGAGADASGAGASSGGTLSAATPTVRGPLDASIVEAVIKRNMAQLRYCYQRELTENPALRGKLTLKFVIAKDGTVPSATTKASTVKDAELEACVTERFMKLQFPEPKGGGTVTVMYPFIFSPGPPGAGADGS